MKKVSIAAILAIIGMAFLVSAQTGFPKTITERTSAMATVIAQGSPYTYIIPIDVSSANWGRPSNVIVSGVYFARFTTMKFKPTNGDTLSMPLDSLSGWPFAVDSIYKTGTDSLSRINKIFIIANKRN